MEAILCITCRAALRTSSLLLQERHEFVFKMNPLPSPFFLWAGGGGWWGAVLHHIQ